MSVAKRCQSGFTLVEALIAMVVVGMVMLGALHTIHAGHAQTYAGLHGMRAQQLAEALMEEILTRKYEDPSLLGSQLWAGDADRSEFETVQEYHGLIEPAGTLVDDAGEAYEPAYQVFSREVRCDYQTLDVPTFDHPVDGIAVTITVEDQRERQWEFVRFIPEPEDHDGGGLLGL